jgi:anti-sigma B factor antagonist
MPERITFDPPAPGELLIDIKKDAESVVVGLTGELDLATAETFERHLCEAESTRPTRVIVDLGALGFMDSTGLQTLLRARERASTTEYELVLRRGPHQVQRVFELTRTDEVFNFED